MNDNYTYLITGYTDDYFQRLDGHDNSGYQYAFIKFILTEYGTRIKQETLFFANSFEEVEIKLAIFGFKLKSKENMNPGSFIFVEYDVERI